MEEGLKSASLALVVGVMKEVGADARAPPQLWPPPGA